MSDPHALNSFYAQNSACIFGEVSVFFTSFSGSLYLDSMPDHWHADRNSDWLIYFYFVCVCFFFFFLTGTVVVLLE